jgi:3-dehydroquinate synthase
LDRKSCIFALGGGVIGDVAGFAAATYLRGVPYVHAPTTLLAQVDSSVGGKTAVDHGSGKNLIGAFYQPRFVLIDVNVLRTLPRRELVAGVAEIIKYGIIEDPALFRLLENNMDKLVALDRELLAQVIGASCAIKARVVEQDERESDYRAVLNFGHTIGHALEAATDYKGFLHGEAVAIGMIKALEISHRFGYCDQTTCDRARDLIARAGLPLEIPEGITLDSLIEHLEVDKKSAGGKLKFVMCAGLAKTRFQSLTPQEIIANLQTLR